MGRGERERETTTVTLVFTDIVSSTELTEAHGDRGWSALLGAHDATVREAVARHGGREVKHLGDGFMLSFDSASRAIACAVALQQQLASGPVAIRIGVHTGEVERRGDDYSGWHVTLAARIAASGGAGDIVVSAATCALVAPAGEHTFDEGRPTTFKGIAAKQVVHRLRLDSADAAAPTDAGLLRVRVLGPLTVEGLAAKDIGSRKARSLVTALTVARGMPVPADVLAELLWGDDAPARPAEQIGVLASRLRRSLGAGRIERTDAGYSLLADWSDLDELDARVAEAATRLADGNAAAARVAVVAALELVRGPLAADEDALWFDDERRAAERVVARARSLLAEASLANGDPGSAAAAADQALDHDPYDEAALRLLMRAHLALGRPASALAAYARVRERLGEDLGVDPAPETEELHTAILRGEVSSPQSAMAPVASAAVGRDDERARLDELLAMARAGAAVGLVIEGDAGIGKTTLAHAWATDMAATGSVVLTGRCDELGRDLPLQPLLDALEAHLRRLGQAEAEQLLGDEAAIIGPLLVQAPVARSSATVLAGAEAGQALLHAALLAVVLRARGAGPVVLVIDDLHNAATGTVEWLRFALRRGDHLLVLATRRSGEGLGLSGAATLALGPIDVEAAAAIVGDELAAELHARAGGNPLFLVELAASGDTMPASIREAVTARTASLGDDAATTIRTAAVLGQVVDLDLLAAVLRRPAGELLEHLDMAVDGRLLVEREGRLDFGHELTREALAADASATRTAYLHREAARSLAERANADPLEVGWHARLGGDTDLAAGALVRAGELAASRFDAGEAERLLSEAIDFVDSPAARIARARVRLGCWDTAGAGADADRAIELDGGLPAIELAGWVAYYRRDHDLARRYAEEGMARAGEPELRASCLALAGRFAHSRGDVVEAEAHLQEAMETAPAGNRGIAQIWLAGLRNHQGMPAEAADLAARGVLDAERINHPFAALHGLFSHVHALGSLGRITDALAAVDRLDAAIEREGAQGRRFVLVSRNLRGWLLRNLGLIAEADEQNLGPADADPADPALAEPRYVANLDLVEGRLAVDDIDGAADRLDRIASLETWQGSMAWHQRQRYGLQRARVALAQGDGEGALALAEEVAADAAARTSHRYGALAVLLVARVRADAASVSSIPSLLDQVEGVAALEAWWLTAEAAAQLDSSDLWDAAERRVEHLARQAGVHADALRGAARERFDRLAVRPGR